MSSGYPPARRGEAIEVLAGSTFPDPFRGLEDDSHPEVIAWQQAQADLADAHIDGLPGIAGLRDRVAHYLTGRTPPIPRFAGGKWIRPVPGDGPNRTLLVASGEPMGEGKTVFDTAGHVDELGRTPVISWCTPSPDGGLLAVGLCHDGSEANIIRVVDIEAGHLLDDRPPQVLMDNWSGGAQWLPDSSGFFYVALVGSKEEFTLRVFRHDIGEPARTTPEPVPVLDGAGLEYLAVFVSRDGRWAVVSQDLLHPKPVAVLDLSEPGGGWRPFITDLDATVAGHVVGGEYIAITDLNAPRGSVVAIRMTSPADVDPTNWRTVVPESRAVIRSVTPVGDLLYLTELVDTYARVRIVDRQGAERGRVPLPGLGSLSTPLFPLMTMIPRGHPDEFLFGFSTLTESWGVHRHRPGEKTMEILAEPAARIDAVVERHWATSADGTRVPYHLLRRPDLSTTAPRPTLIYAYGGYNAPLDPQFPRAMGTVVDAGGLLVYGHIRGGGEFGRAWWEGGRLANKANCYADLFAIAEDLIANGRTTAERLGVTGGSNGGHLAGVAVTRRPELWRAAVSRVPILDLLGAHRDPYARACLIAELGDPDAPHDVARLAEISPYHLIKDGTAYPAVYIDVGATDIRCSAWHGRKFAARLQEATADDRPIYLRVWDNAGHGFATAKETEIRQHTACMAFLLDQLGLGMGQGQ
jgi:prolyl oligopeptidase